MYICGGNFKLKIVVPTLIINEQINYSNKKKKKKNHVNLCKSMIRL